MKLTVSLILHPVSKMVIDRNQPFFKIHILPPKPQSLAYPQPGSEQGNKQRQPMSVYLTFLREPDKYSLLFNP